ncbi:hypothetical protein A5670_10445 [Mycolicibacterium fortuitum]|nr:hypothetical protein A5670_10445 [Mycolicibacterium fortuitum]
MFPRILICDDLDTVLRNVQGSGPVQIGSAVREPGTISRALKKCAPLTAGAWAIWVERQPGAFRYGVFREPLPTALDIRATLLDTPASDALRAILIAQFAAGTIEMVSPGRRGMRIHLSGQRDDELSTEDTQQKVADWSATGISDERIMASYRTFAATALQDLLRKGHGTLIAVVPCGKKAWRRNATDAVHLDEPIDLAWQLGKLADDATSLALFELSTSIELVAGMLSSDGITVFDTCGRVLAFGSAARIGDI